MRLEIQVPVRRRQSRSVRRRRAVVLLFAASRPRPSALFSPKVAAVATPPPWAPPATGLGRQPSVHNDDDPNHHHDGPADDNNHDGARVIAADLRVADDDEPSVRGQHGCAVERRVERGGAECGPGFFPSRPICS